MAAARGYRKGEMSYSLMGTEFQCGKITNVGGGWW